MTAPAVPKLSSPDPAQAGPTASRRAMFIGLLIFSVALGLRLWVLGGMETYPRFELIKNRLDDQVHFHLWADGLAQGRPIDLADNPHEYAHWSRVHPETYTQAPLYPWILSWLYRLGLDFDAVRRLQAVLGALTAGLVFGAARRLQVRLPVAVAAGLAAAAFGPWVFYDGTLLRVSWIQLVTAAVLCSALDLTRHRTRSAWTRRAAVFGALCSLGVLLRPNFLLPALLLSAWLLYRRLAHQHPAAAGPRRPTLREAVALLLPLLLPILAVAAVNTVRSGEPQFISSNGPFNLYIGNVHDGHGIASTTPTYLALKASAPADEIDLVAEAWGEIHRHPADWAALHLRKLGMLFGGDEVPNNLSYAMARRTNPRLAWAGIEFHHLTGLALIGMAPALRRLRRHAVLLLFFSGYLAATLPFVVPSRLRQPLTLVLLITAALGLDALISLARKAGSRPRILLGLGISTAILLPILTTPSHPLRSADYLMAAAAEYSKGELHERGGRPGHALEHYRLAVMWNPQHPEALAGVERLAVPPTDQDPRVQELCDQARLAAERGEHGDALKLLQQAAELDPHDPMPWRFQANVHYMAKDRDAAVRAQEEAVRRAPWDEPLRRGLLVLRGGT